MTLSLLDVRNVALFIYVNFLYKSDFDNFASDLCVCMFDSLRVPMSALLSVYILFGVTCPLWLPLMRWLIASQLCGARASTGSLQALLLLQGADVHQHKPLFPLFQLPGPVDQAFSGVLPRGPASPSPGCVTRTRTVPMAPMSNRIAVSVESGTPAV